MYPQKPPKITPKSTIPKQFLNILCISLGLLIFFYIALRAFYVPPISDEVSTFFFYIQPGSFQPFYAHLDANNHVLNSLLAHLSFLAFGDHIFFLRLPNVLSFLLYLFFVWKFKTKFNSQFIGLAWFLTMISAPYFLDFFHLCRGYGMSMAFLLGSIYHLITFQLDKKNKNLFFALLFGSFGLWANLSLVIPVLLIGVFSFIFSLSNFIKTKKGVQLLIRIGILLLLFIAPFIYAILYTLELKDGGMLYHGKNGSFLATTLTSLMDEFSDPFKIPQYFFGIWFLLYIMLGVYTLVRKRIRPEGATIHALLFGTLIGLVLLHHILGVGYPMDRAAVYLFPLLLASFFHTMDQSNFTVAKIIAATPVLFFIPQLSAVINLRYTQHWKAEAVPEKYYTYMKKWSEVNGVLPTISTSYLQNICFAWYDFQNNGSLNSAIDVNYPDTLADFIITNPGLNKNTIEPYDTIFFDANTKVSLLKRDKMLKWEEVEVLKDVKPQTSNGNIHLFKISTGQYPLHPFLFDIQFKAQSSKKNMRCFLIYEILDSSNNNSLSQSLDIERIIHNAQQPTLVHRRLWINNIPSNSNSISFYIWNVNNKQITVSDLKLKTYRLAK